MLLAFFPVAFTGVCTAEMCDFSSNLARFRGSRTEVLGISVDAIPSLQQCKKKMEHELGQKRTKEELLAELAKLPCDVPSHLV